MNFQNQIQPQEGEACWGRFYEVHSGAGRGVGDLFLTLGKLRLKSEALLEATIGGVQRGNSHCQKPAGG